MPNDRYTITGQEPGRLIGPTGAVVRGTVVTFKSKANDVTGQVEIPESQYSADAVNRAVLAAVDVIDQVHNL